MTTNTKQNDLRELAEEAVRRGLDFFVRNQIRDTQSADHGRFPYVYDCETNAPVNLTTNWTTGVVVSALLAGYRHTGDKAYLEAAGRGCEYIKSLQEFAPEHAPLQGVFHEVTPQSDKAHPRDALTAAWALLDYSLIVDDQVGIERAKIYADWFVETGCEKGFPYWTVQFDGNPWYPTWCGSFHSGSAFFMYRLYSITGEEKYLKTMRLILDFYNSNHIDGQGQITVVVDRETQEGISGEDARGTAPINWQVMHHYNDDFGALANLAAWKVTGEDSYRDSAMAFFGRMCASQYDHGGFGSKTLCVPSAGGAIVIEMLAARELGLQRAEYDVAIERAIPYLLGLQKVSPGNPADGAFFGMTGDYQLSDSIANSRTAAYAIMGLIRYAGSRNEIYFLDGKSADA